MKKVVRKLTHMKKLLLILLLIVGCDLQNQEDDENSFKCISQQIPLSTFIVSFCSNYDTSTDNCWIPAFSVSTEGPLLVRWVMSENCSTQNLCDLITNEMTCEEWCEENSNDNCVDSPDADYDDCPDSCYIQSDN